MADQRGRVWNFPSPPLDLGQATDSISKPETSVQSKNVPQQQVQSQAAPQLPQSIPAANGLRQSNVQSVPTQTLPQILVANNGPPAQVQHNACRARIKELQESHELDEEVANDVLKCRLEDIIHLKAEVEEMKEGAAQSAVILNQERQRIAELEERKLQLRGHNAGLMNDLNLANQSIEIERALHAATERRLQERIYGLLDIIRLGHWIWVYPWISG